MNIDILAFGAHPDDVELACVGTLLNAVDRGQQVAIVDLTGGELGTRGSKELRHQEALASAALIGASYRHNLDLGDGFFEINQTNLLKIVAEIRYAKPQIVLANSLDDRHPDHGRAAELVHRAVFLSGLRKIVTSYEGEEQDPWRPKACYHYIQDKNLDPDIVVDISKNFEKKIECIRCFSSQFYDPNSKEPDTPLTRPDFIDFIYGKAKTYGRHIGVEYAEMFNTKRYIGVADLSQLL